MATFGPRQSENQMCVFTSDRLIATDLDGVFLLERHLYQSSPCSPSSQLIIHPPFLLMRLCTLAKHTMWIPQSYEND